MKKIIAFALFMSLAFAAFGQGKMLSLEQASENAFKQQVIDQGQKQNIDSIIVKLNKDRAALNAELRSGAITKDQHGDKGKQISTDFTNELRKILRTQDKYVEWMEVRRNVK